MAKYFFWGYTVGTETVNYIVINDLKIRATEKLLFIAQSLSNQIKIEVIMKCSNKINFPMKPFNNVFFNIGLCFPIMMLKWS